MISCYDSKLLSLNFIINIYCVNKGIKYFWYLLFGSSDEIYIVLNKVEINVEMYVFLVNIFII